jgi:hypothetical protein
VASTCHHRLPVVVLFTEDVAHLRVAQTTRNTQEVIVGHNIMNNWRVISQMGQMGQVARQHAYNAELPLQDRGAPYEMKQKGEAYLSRKQTG